jgi:hypothetical protein
MMIKLMSNGCTGQKHDFDKATAIFFNKIRLNACLLPMQVGAKSR